MKSWEDGSVLYEIKNRSFRSSRKATKDGRGGFLVGGECFWEGVLDVKDIF